MTKKRSKAKIHARKNIRAQKRLLDYISDPSSMKRTPHSRGSWYDAETKLLLETAIAVHKRERGRDVDPAVLRRTRATAARLRPKDQARKERINKILSAASESGFLDDLDKKIQEMSQEQRTRFLSVKYEGLKEHWKIKRAIEIHAHIESEMADVVVNVLNPVLEKILRPAIRLPQLVDARQRIKSTLSGTTPAQVGRDLQDKLVTIEAAIQTATEDVYKRKVADLDRYFQSENQGFKSTLQISRNRIVDVVRRLKEGVKRIRIEANAFGKAGGANRQKRAQGLRQLASSIEKVDYFKMIEQMISISDNEIIKEFRDQMERELGIADVQSKTATFFDTLERTKFTTIGNIIPGRFYQISYIPRWMTEEYDPNPFIFVIDNDYPLHYYGRKNKQGSNGILAFNFNLIPPTLAKSLFGDIMSLQGNLINLKLDQDLNTSTLKIMTDAFPLRRATVRQYHYEWNDVLTDYRPDTGYAALTGYVNVPYDMVYRKIIDQDLKYEPKARR